MRTWGLWLALVLFGGNATAADKPLRMEVMGEIAIDHAGAVYDYKVSTLLTPEVKQLVERVVRQWKFEPVVRDGKPVYARSNMLLTLTATPVDAGYQLQVEDVRFLGSRSLRQPVAPEYPHEAMRAGVGAMVLVALRIDAEGRVLDAAAARSSLIGARGGERSLDRWRRRFEEVSVQAMRRWTFQAADVVAGDAPETTIIIPVAYRPADSADFSGAWRAEEAGPARPIPWLPQARQAFDAEGLKEGQVLALDNPLKLRTEVEGTKL